MGECLKLEINDRLNSFFKRTKLEETLVVAREYIAITEARARTARISKASRC